MGGKVRIWVPGVHLMLPINSGPGWARLQTRSNHESELGDAFQPALLPPSHMETAQTEMEWVKGYRNKATNPSKWYVGDRELNIGPGVFLLNPCCSHAVMKRFGYSLGNYTFLKKEQIQILKIKHIKMYTLFLCVVSYFLLYELKTNIISVWHEKFRYPILWSHNLRRHLTDITARKSFLFTFCFWVWNLHPRFFTDNLRKYF